MPRGSEGFYLRPMKVGEAGRRFGGSTASDGGHSLVPNCQCGAWHYATSVDRLYWYCVPCERRLDRAYGLILEKQISGSVRDGM